MKKNHFITPAEGCSRISFPGNLSMQSRQPAVWADVTGCLPGGRDMVRHFEDSCSFLILGHSPPSQSCMLLNENEEHEEGFSRGRVNSGYAKRN